MINEATLAETLRRLRQGELPHRPGHDAVESRHPRHQARRTQLLVPLCRTAVTPCDWALPSTTAAGKVPSEAFGMLLIREGLKVAVIAVDSSSPVTGGSILGTKPA
ncbi:hypothetical protein ACNKHP_09190 [Shigella boydii]